MVARLEPPVQGSTVEENYSSYVFDHWANRPKAVNNLRLTATNFPCLLDSPATSFNSPLKNEIISKSAMKNSLSPSHAPRASRSTSKGEDPYAFGDIVDHLAAKIRACPIPANTPTYYTLYKGSYAYGDPKQIRVSSPYPIHYLANHYP